MDAELPVLETFTKLGIALGLGLLVGMQRERTDSRIAGIRTFPLITILGTVTALLSARFGGWVLAAGFLSLAALIIGRGNGQTDAGAGSGVTTEAAMFLMFGVGAYLVAGHASVAVTLGGSIALLLHLKPEMHAFARKIGDKDFKAIMQFVLITLVILPVLPNQGYGPYTVLNPFQIWLMVILIVGISLGGYVAHKLLGERSGAMVAGLLGGLISSTATTVSWSRRAREVPESASMSALVIMMASAVLFARVLVVAGIVAPGLFPAVAGPLGAMFGVMALTAGAMWRLTRKAPVSRAEPANPTELKPALLFGLLFAIVLLGVAAAKAHFGAQGLYAAAIVSGLPDMDAITLSTLELSKGGQIDANTAWRMILAASMANLVFKAILAATLGNRKLFVRLAIPFGLALAAGLLILWVWPASGLRPSPGAAGNGVRRDVELSSADRPTNVAATGTVALHRRTNVERFYSATTRPYV